MTRYYGKSTLRPHGIPEDPTRCIAEVADETGWHFYQCKRKRGYGPGGLYCKQHAKIIESRRKQSKRTGDSSMETEG